MNKKLRAYLLISLLAICWGSIPLIIRTSDVSSMSLVGIRTFLGTIFLLIFVLKKRQITKDLLYSGIFLGPLLAIHWSTMFKSIELNTVAVGIGLVFLISNIYFDNRIVPWKKYQTTSNCTYLYWFFWLISSFRFFYNLISFRCSLWTT